MIQVCKFFFEEITEKIYFNVIPFISYSESLLYKVIIKKSNDHLLVTF